MDIALKRVRDWIPGTALDLDWLGLSSLPPLPATLQTLICSNNRITSLLPLPTTLQSLNCSNNHLTSLPPLPTTLQMLGCSKNQLTSLPPLPTSLQMLGCSKNHLTSLPPLPISLQDLMCSNNQLTFLPPLPTQLQTLRCDHNQLISLPPLPATLHALRCNDNRLTSLSFIKPTQQIVLIQRSTSLYTWTDNMSVSCLGNIFPDYTENEPIVDYRLRVDMWEQETICKPRIQHRTRLVKEELMMNRWHPIRIEAALEAGLDLECL